MKAFQQCARVSVTIQLVFCIISQETRY